MKVYLGADHRGFKLKEELRVWLLENKISVEDLGAFEYNSNDDYPLFAQAVAKNASWTPLLVNRAARGAVKRKFPSAVLPQAGTLLGSLIF